MESEQQERAKQEGYYATMRRQIAEGGDVSYNAYEMALHLAERALMKDEFPSLLLEKPNPLDRKKFYVRLQEVLEEQGFAFNWEAEPLEWKIRRVRTRDEIHSPDYTPVSHRVSFDAGDMPHTAIALLPKRLQWGFPITADKLFKDSDIDGDALLALSQPSAITANPDRLQRQQALFKGWDTNPCMKELRRTQ